MDSEDKEIESLNEWEEMLDTNETNSSNSKEPGSNEIKKNVSAKGIKAVLDKALQSYEKLPMLEIVFDRLVRLLSTSLRNLTSETIEVSIITMNSLRFSEYVKTIPSTALINVFKAIEWENLGLLTVDSSLIFSMVDILFGGKRNAKDAFLDDRTHTEIEQALVQEISNVILGDLSAAFDVVSPISFIHDRIETNPTFATIARPGDAVMLLQLKVDMESRGGKIDLLIPYATIDPIRDLLVKVFMGDSFNTDDEWEQTLVNIAYDIDVPIEAIITNIPLKIQDVTTFQVGKTIMLDHEYKEEITVNSSGVTLFKGRLGKLGNKTAVHVTDLLFKKIK